MQGINFPSTAGPAVGPGTPPPPPPLLRALQRQPPGSPPSGCGETGHSLFSSLWQEALLGKGDTRAWGTEAQGGASGQLRRMEHGRARSPDGQAGAVILHSQG